jgi:zinc transport system substrate-binding protein
VRAAQALFFFPLTFCFALLSYPSFGEPISVFTSILPSSYLVERIGGDAVQVSTLVEPGQSPETYEPTPRQMALLSGSQLYFRIGVPFENVWMDKIASMNPKKKVVDLRQGIALREIEGHRQEEGEAPSLEAGHEEHGKDPHLWLSLRNASIMAETIAGALEQCTPELKEQFQKNLTGLLAEMKQADDDVQRLLAPFQGRRFMVFHPAWGYFADDYGLEQIPIEIEGKSPNARALARMIDQAKAENVRVIFVQKQFSTVSAEAVAKAIGGKVVAMDPLSPDYVNNFRRIAQTLVEGMQ